MDLRIDELAQRSGTTSRTIRVYQSKGLLPAPRLEGRTGFYGPEHLQRLALIEQLQERGFSLAAIRETLDAWASGGDFARLVGFDNLVTAPVLDEQPRQLAPDELLGLFPGLTDPEQLQQAIAKAVEVGVLVATDDGFEAPSPMLIEAGSELARIGVPVPVILDLVAAIRVDLADVADRFVQVVSEHVIQPLVIRSATGDPDTNHFAGEVADTLKRLRGVAVEVVRPFVAQELERAAREAAVSAGLLPAPEVSPTR